MRYEQVDRLPVMMLEPYEVLAIERWRTQGLPAGQSPEEFLQMDQMVYVPLTFLPKPAFEQRVLSEDEDYVIQVDSMGAIVRRRKDAPLTYYGYLEHPVKNRSDWDRYRERFRPVLSERLPADWGEAWVRRLDESPNPVSLCLFPFFFRLGFYTMGMERFMTAFYEDPELIRGMFAYWTDFVCTLIEPVLKTLKIDCLVLAEDLAHRASTHIAPNVYSDFWYPHQDRVVQLAVAHNVPVISMWSAGNVQPILQGLLEHGFNSTWPLERRTCGLDPLVLRRRYGRALTMAGNIPREALVEGPEAIDKEIERLMPMIRAGGFIPTLDDMVPIEAPFAHFQHLVERLKAIRL
jgi:uroporphyrinogen decarboxylase